MKKVCVLLLLILLPLFLTLSGCWFERSGTITEKLSAISEG